MTHEDVLLIVDAIKDLAFKISMSLAGLSFMLLVLTLSIQALNKKKG